MTETSPQPPSESHGQSTGLTTSLVAKAPELRRAPSPSHQREVSSVASDTTSDQATAAFVRCTLCAHQLHASTLAGSERGRATPPPLSELLPPLTSSNEVDLQLYALIAVVAKEFVHGWYSNITPDHTFVDEIVRIIAHCTRALEQRLRKADLEALLLDEIPDAITAHVHAYGVSRQSLHPGRFTSDPRLTYHTLRPHPALSPNPVETDPVTVLEQQQNEAAWRRLLVEGILTVLLPTEDLENGCLRTLVTEVLSEMVIGNGIAGKACEGWLLWEAITKLVEAACKPVTVETSVERQDETTVNRLEHFGLLSTEAATKPIACASHQGAESVWASRRFWQCIQYVYLGVIALRTIITALLMSGSILPRPAISPFHGASQREPAIDEEKQPPRKSAPLAPPSPLAILNMSLWSCVGVVLELDMRMPWLSGLLSLLKWTAVTGPGKVGDTNGRVDKLLSHYFHNKLLRPSLVTSLLLTMRTSLFPHNSLAPARVPPTPAEALVIKRRCASTIVDAIPAPLASRLFGTGDVEAVRLEVEERLDVLGDSYLNKHLLFALVELLVVRLLPEMGEQGVRDLMELRL
ncbi:PXA domain-containing protein, partial [Cryomyces antarcticus]